MTETLIPYSVNSCSASANPCPEVIPYEVRAQIDVLAQEQRNLKLEMSIKDALLVEVRYVLPQVLWRRTGRLTRAL